MSKDYKDRAAKPRQAKAKAPGFLWFIAGTLLGAFFIGLAWLKLSQNLLTGKEANPLLTTTHQQAPETSKAPEAATSAAPAPLKFEFADMLRKAKVELPVHDANAPPVKPTQPPPALAPKPVAVTPALELQPQHHEDSTDSHQTIAEEPKATRKSRSKHSEATMLSHKVARSNKHQRSNDDGNNDDDEPRVHRETTIKLKHHKRSDDGNDDDEPRVHREIATRSKHPKHQRSNDGNDDEPPVHQRTAHIPNRSNTVVRAKATAKKPLVLQVGAFKNDEDLRQLRARMALMGVETKVEKVTTKDHRTIHRLRTGPYGSKDELEEARRLLNRHNVKSSVVAE